MRLAAAAFLALISFPVFAETAPRTPAPFTIVPLVELTEAQFALSHARPAVAQAAIDRAATSLTRTQALAGGERMRLAADLLAQLHESRAALGGMREAEAQAMLAQIIQILRSQAHY